MLFIILTFVLLSMVGLLPFKVVRDDFDAEESDVTSRTLPVFLPRFLTLLKCLSRPLPPQQYKLFFIFGSFIVLSFTFLLFSC